MNVTQSGNRVGQLLVNHTNTYEKHVPEAKIFFTGLTPGVPYRLYITCEYQGIPCLGATLVRDGTAPG